MTEQPPSAEAQALAETIHKWQGHAFLDGRVAEAIDALIARRVSAETERCRQIAYRRRVEADMERGKTADPLNGWRWAADTAGMIEREIRAPAERPAPPQRHLTGGEREVLHKALLASSTLVHSGDAQDYTERALQAARDAVESVPSELWIDRRNSETIAQAIAPDFAEFASAVASERDAAAIRALQEPDVREAVAKASCGAYGDNYDEQPPDIETLREWRKREGGDGTVRAYDPGLPTQKDWLDVADAALTKIAEMLK